ncbi:DNA repair protein RecO [Aquimarina intermedia]|uniref:DNA repair protein RecO n=1 Tax=Aquimarina intermedia TaxID=350814 RepID=A0A5S5CA44_9FLAO|nr:DNA repair protein RecO [Aquimarina intermedia]TYP76214.1 DNA replication and repair protein RecO [Aquimarina intermedia]
MIIKSSAIVLRTIRYSENDVIATLFTQSNGVRSYMLRGILKSKKGKLRHSLFQPLSLLEIEAVHKDKGTLERIREAKILTPYQTLHNDLVKNALVFFISEVLYMSIQEQETNKELYQYLETTLLWLDNHEDIKNFHLSFMIRLTQYLGFYPDTSWQEKPYFDLLSGDFTSMDIGPYCFDGTLIEKFKLFLGMTFEASMKIDLSKTMRAELLNMVLLYFELHLHGFKKPKSLTVLNEIFK